MSGTDTGTKSAGAESLAREMATALDSANCDDVLVLDVRELSQVTDYIVLGSGTSDRQMHTAGEKAEEKAEARGEKLFRQHADAASTWVLLDFVDVVVHIFEPNTRAHFDLEMLWGDAPRIPWSPARKAGQNAAKAP